MAVSQADIQAWFAANPGATDAQISQAMQQYGVGVAQLAPATGVDHSEVQRRLSIVRNGKEFTDRAYGQAPATPAAPAPVSNNQITDWLGQNAGASDAQIRAAMQQYGVSTGQLAGATGMNQSEVQRRYDAAGPGYYSSGLASNSGANDTANAYKQYLNSIGSKDTEATRSDANAYLLNLGMNQGDIINAYTQFRANQPQLAGEGDLARQASDRGVALQDPTRYDQQNPYLQQMGDSITSQVTDNLQRNIMPGIRSSAVSSGNFGGSRQGVVEANAIKDANQGISNSLTQMRFGDYNNTMARQAQRYGQDQGYNLQLGNQDQSYNLGLGNLALGNKNSDQGFYTQQRGQDLQQVGLGASLFGQGNQGMLNQGQGIYNLGLTGQQAPWQSMQNFGNVSQPYTGFGSSSQNQSGSAGAGFLGGALAGSQAYNIFSK